MDLMLYGKFASLTGIAAITTCAAFIFFMKVQNIADELPARCHGTDNAARSGGLACAECDAYPVADPGSATGGPYARLRPAKTAQESA